MILQPLLEFRVTIMRDDPPKYALRKALMVAWTSTNLDSVVEVNIGKSTDIFKDYLGPYKVPYLLTPALYTLINAIPSMRQLRTIQLNNIILSKMYLRAILSAPHPIHLILDTVQLPKISSFRPATLRKLTLTMMSSWENVQPFVAQLATSLEYLELKSCKFPHRLQLQLPSFPCLQEMRYHQHYTRSNVPGVSELSQVLRLAPQVTRLYVTGRFHKEPLTACRESLQYLFISSCMLSEYMFGSKPFPRLKHLSLTDYEFFCRANRPRPRPPLPSSFILDHFPMITSLTISMLWKYRNHAMETAQSQHRLKALKLDIIIRDEIEDHEIDPYFPVEAPNDQPHRTMLPAALQTLKLEVTQYDVHDKLERSAARCSRWVCDDVIPSVTGLGGPALKSIDLLVSLRKGRPTAREQVLSRQWVKVPNGDWHRAE